MTQLALWLMRALHWLPLPLLRALGSGLGALLHCFASRRRRVAEINLKLCFPQLHDAERAALVRAVFRAFGQSVVDRAFLWHSSAECIRERIQLAGEAHLERLCGPFAGSAGSGNKSDANGTTAASSPGAEDAPNMQAVILLAPHFVGMDAAWTRLTLLRPMAGTYARQTNPAFDAALYAGRTRFGGLALARQDGVRATVRELKNGLPFYTLPDMDFGARDAVFAPFFGVPAATITAMSRLARLTGARVLPVVTRMTAEGYTVTIHPPWEAYPGASDEDDARRMNAFIEGEVRQNLAQYHWLHKRFKTRPVGEPGLY